MFDPFIHYMQNNNVIKHLKFIYCDINIKTNKTNKIFPKFHVTR
uniref:Uncharacterized protein n=1 Tax=Ciona intestinalis TaxID=7719 RepID=H2XQZ3_CIOIN